METSVEVFNKGSLIPPPAETPDISLALHDDHMEGFATKTHEIVGVP